MSLHQVSWKMEFQDKSTYNFVEISKKGLSRSLGIFLSGLTNLWLADRPMVSLTGQGGGQIVYGRRFDQPGSIHAPRQR